MSEITAITAQKNDKTRCNIEVDGRFFCGMELVTVVQNRLKVGTAVTEEELSAMQLESEKQTAFDKALNFISASMKTEREIEEYLQKKGYLNEVCGHVVGKMREYGFLDDASYARAYAESAEKKKGSRLIALELRRKGVSDEAIEEALSTLTGEEEAAAAVLQKYLRGKDVTEKQVLRKAYAHLISKGFDHDAARHALEGLYDED